MQPQDWLKIKEVFALTLEQPAERRASFLREVCVDDFALRQEVESLLEANAEPDPLLEQTSYALASIINANGNGYAGKEFGNYRIVREIGRGGMGAVFLAERSDGEFQQQVALKIMRRSFAEPELERRFRQERQILASLSHPNIARLLDGGVGPDGEPFLAMEYVEGVRIDKHCNAHDLPTRERLKLFLAVCQGVSYAHQNLVVHRDLKPSNILVTADGTPKLLDFGIAKLLDAEHAGEHTQTSFRAYTPEYAAPEQVRGELITTASDVYSLGVLLHVLLFGSVGGRTEQKTVATNRQTNRNNEVASKKPRVVSDELRNIITVARREETARRYESVAEFAQDVQRYLDGRPVHAQKDGFTYRATKFAGRNRIAVGAAVLVLSSLIVGLAFSLWQFRNAQRESIRAQLEGVNAKREGAKAEAVNDFLQRMLAASNPGVNLAGTKGRETTLDDLLNIASQRLDSEDLATQPEVKAELQRIIGASYLSQGQYDRAEQNLRAALAVQTKLFGENSPETLQTLVSLGTLAIARADYAGAEQIFQLRLAILRAGYQQGRIQAALLLAALNDFAILRRARGNSREAEALLREGLALSSNIPPEGHGNVESAEAVLALTLLDQGKFAEAELHSRKLVAEIRQKPNNETGGFCSALTMLGSVLMEEGALDEADARLREAEVLYHKLYDSNAVAIYDNLRLQAQVQYLRGNYSEADAKINQTLENYRQNSKPQYISFATALTLKGLILNKLDKGTEAEKILREAVRLRDEYLPPDHFMSALTKSGLGECLTSRKRYDEAESLLLGSYESLKNSQGGSNPRTRLALQRLVALYEKWGRPDVATEYRSKLTGS